ncbi:MAG: D-2-hydroxyacid dehydrogenase [Anaerolineae bacterium]|nr:D-2-hydroxyacid dehydrogenase [Anaerolineae bacterium]
MDDTINVLVLADFSDAIMDRLRLVSPRLRFTRKQVKSSGDVPRDVWAATDILYTARVLPDPDVALRLRWVQAHFAGVDSILDHPLFKNTDILLTTASGIHASTMAEFTFAMILAFARRIPTMLRLQAKGEWPEDRFTLFLPKELRGSTVGIAGYGSIGRAIARLAHAFGMQVLATKRNAKDPSAGPEYEEDGVGDPAGEFVDRLYPPEALRSMSSLCDFVVNTLPLTSGTRNAFDAGVFAAMKPTAVFVNVGRGGTVDEDALVAALVNKEIGGAGLDVYAREPLPADSPLWRLDNVILSPHIAGNTTRYNELAADVFVQNLERYLEKRDLLNRVDFTRGY